MITKHKDSMMHYTWFLDFSPSIKCKKSLLYVQSMGAFYVNSNFKTERNHFNTILVAYTLSGVGRLIYQNHEYLLQEGDAFIIDCNQYHCYYTDSNNSWNLKWVHFNGDTTGYISEIIENSPVYNDSKISTLLDNIQDIMKTQPLNYDIYSSLYLHELCTCFMLLSRKKSPRKNEIPAIIGNAVNFMEERYTQKISLVQLCKHLNISKYYLCRIFKQYMQCGPYEYLINYRIMQSKLLLKTTDLSIEVIAEKIGFTSTSHFVKTFNLRENTTPFKYRTYYLKNLT